VKRVFEQKWLLTTIGLLFVGLATLGVFLPVLPTTPFLLVAGACFAKSSPRLHRWLLANKTFGPLIYHWQTTRSIPKKAKIISLVSIALTSAWSCYILEQWYLKVLVLMLISWPVYFIVNLPLSENVAQQPKNQ